MNIFLSNATGVSQSRNFVALAFCLAVSFAPLAQAESTWNASSGNWDNAGNWVDDLLPTSGDTVIITNNGTALLPSGVTGEYNTLNIGTGSGESGAVEISGGLLSGQSTTLGQAEGSQGSATISSGTWSNPFLYIGDGGTGSLTIDGGLVSSEYGFLGFGSTGSGSATVNDGEWNVSALLYIGLSSSGTLTVNGGLVSSAVTYIGESGAGTVVVTGGTWNNSVSMNVGSNSSGSLTISGGLVSVNSSINTGSTPSGMGAITLSGSGVLEVSGLEEGSGMGAVTLDGGVLRANTDQNNFLLGYEAGDVTIEDGGAFIDSNGHEIGIGTDLAGTGALTKQGAGQLTLSGSNSHSGGTVVEAGTLAVANNDALGSGAVEVQAASILSIQTGFTVTNQITLAGGTLAQGLADEAGFAGALVATSNFAGGNPNTTSALLAGTTSEAVTITASFSPTSAGSNSEILRSDVLSLEGMYENAGVTDVFVLELSMTNVEPGSYLGWLNGSDVWVNAALGNTGNNALAEMQGYAGSFEDFQLEYDELLLSQYIGAWGFTSTSVWAVLNHNSDFGVIPEPSTVALVILGSGGLLMRRRRVTQEEGESTEAGSSPNRLGRIFHRPPSSSRAAHPLRETLVLGRRQGS